MVNLKDLLSCQVMQILFFLLQTLLYLFLFLLGSDRENIILNSDKITACE